MASSVSRLRRWFALGVIVMVVTVGGMYFYARWSLRKAVREVPAKLGLDIQQTAEGFSISKSEQGRTLFTVSASKAVQFKQGGRAELHNVKIVVYGKDSGRFDRIAGDDFEYDPASGNVSAKGRVLIDLEANPEGMRQSDQSLPEQAKQPIHLETNGLVFNKNTGDASASGKVVFETQQASGSAVGIQYVAKTGSMNLLSAVAVTAGMPQPVHLNAERGTISKRPREVVFDTVRLTRERQRMQSDHATFFLRDDNTVDHILAEGDVETELQGRPSTNSKTLNSDTHERSDRAELFLTGTRNFLTTAVLSGHVRISGGDAASRVSTGMQGRGMEAPGMPAEADAGRVTLHFGAEQILKTVHAEDGVRLTQEPAGRAGTPVTPLLGAPSAKDAQEVEMTAPVMDFIVKDGRLLERAETAGPPQIVISQPDANQKTVVTAAKFTAKFTEKNRLATLHGEPDAKIVSGILDVSKAGATKGGTNSATGPTDRVSTSKMLDVVFLPEGGVRSITQSGGLTYVDGAQKAWAERGDYTASDQMLVLSGSPRVADAGMTTTAQTIRMNRTTGDAIAEGNVKSTYSDLKPQSDGGMLASSDPIHVTSRSMTAHRSPAVALYTGNARLWQNANVVEAPVLQFDREHRSLVAHGMGQENEGAELQPVAGHSPATAQTGPMATAQPVSTVLVQVDKTGKVTPVHITSARLNYVDEERRIFLDGGVTAKGPDLTMTGQQMTVVLLPRNQSRTQSGTETPGQVERIVAQGNIIITQPTRHAIGDRLVYTAADDKFVLTGGSSTGSSTGPPSIFDAERGKITGRFVDFL